MRMVFILIASLFLVSCNYYEALDPMGGPTAPIPPETPAGPPTFVTIRADVLQPFCLRCHEGDEPGGGLLIGDYRVLMDDGWIVPKDPDNSSVYLAMVAGNMPKSGSKPTPELIQRVREWIEDGAPEK